MKKVFSELAVFKKKLILLVLTVIVTSAGTLGLPALMQIIIDKAIPSGDYGMTIRVSGYMLILVAASIFCGIATARLAAEISMGVGRNMRREVFAKVQSFSQKEIDTFTTSSLITRTNSDIALVQQFLDTCMQIAIMAPVMCLIGMIMAISTSVTLSSTLVVAIPLLAVTLVIIGKLAIPLSTSIQKKLDRINMIIREKLTGVRVIRAFGTVDFESRRFDEINSDYTRDSKKLNFLLGLFLPAIVLILALTSASVMYIAYRQALAGTATYTTGEVMAVIQYIMEIMAGVTMMTIVILLMPRAAVAAKRAQEVLDSVNEIADPAEPKENPAQHGYLEFKNVSFTYAGADTPAIQGLSFKAAPGETTAIIGGTGMGKTTIVNLIPRLYDVTEGQVLIDGVDVRDYSIADLRKKIGFVPQKAMLFKGTIESNLRFGDDDPAEERVEKAVKIAQSYDFVMKKSEGFNADVAQGGTNFSGGQKQRLCIARALVREAEIYVFDDSFSALDFKTDKALRAALKKETGNATTVIVAQRVSTIMEADRIIVVEKGEIAGIGKHRELLKTCPVYREIVESQMSKEEMDK